MKLTNINRTDPNFAENAIADDNGGDYIEGFIVLSRLLLYTTSIITNNKDSHVLKN